VANRPRFALAVFATLTLALPARAQEPRPGFEIGPFGGLIAFDQDFRVPNAVEFRGLEDTYLVGGRIGYTFSRWIAVEGSVAFSSQTIDPSQQPGSTSIDVTYVTYGLEGLVPLATGNVIPFLAAGLGGLSFDVEAAGTVGESSNVLVGSFGGGLKLPLSPDVVVRVDARDALVRQGEREVLSLFEGGGSIRSNITLTAGLALRFGGPGDEDRDGVLDDRDACPGTERGLPVDKRGCVPEVPEGPPPVKTDADGDGVSDALDLCPGTPPGVVVDLDGCPAPPEGTSPGPDQ
jgi:OOP family OmpA-OmpF porin